MPDHAVAEKIEPPTTHRSGPPLIRPLGRHGARRLDRTTWLIPGFLLLAPVAIFAVFQVQPMAPVMSIDPTLYTAYIENGPDLIDRFGTDRYYWSRAGLVIPGRVLYLLFGAVPGFFVLRYLFALIAIVPAYLLFTRLRSRGAGVAAVLVILLNPVVLRAWTSDYPDGAAISYLIGGTCCLLMPTSPRQRWGWVAGAAAFFTAGVYSNLVVAVLVGSTIGAYVVSGFRARTLRSTVIRVAGELGLLAAGFVVVSAGLAVASELLIGAGNLLSPSLKVLDDMGSGNLRSFHSTTWEWILRETHLFVVPVLLGVWAVLRVGRGGSKPPRAELAIAGTVALQGATFAYWQFLREGSTLENHLYASMLWPGVSLLTVVVLMALWDSVRERWVLPFVAMTVALAPLGYHLVAPRLQFRALPWAPVVFALVIVAVAVARRSARLRAPGAPVVAAAVTVVVVASVFGLTVGKPQNLALLSGQAVQPQASYGSVLFNSEGTYLDQYRVVSKIPEFVPTLDEEPGRVVMAWPTGSSDLVQRAATMYLWNLNAIMLEQGLPVLNDAEASALRADPPRFVLFLGDDDRQFNAGVDALANAGLEPEVRWSRTIASGEQVLRLRFIELRAWMLIDENRAEGGT